MISQTLLKNINTSNRTPRLSEFDLSLQYNGFIWDKIKTHTKCITCMYTGLCNKIYMLLILPYTQKIRLNVLEFVQENQNN